MLKNIKEIKSLILWCKANKIKSFKHENVEFELSDFAFIEQGDLIEQSELAQESREEANLEEKQQLEEDEDLLFWSSN